MSRIRINTRRLLIPCSLLILLLGISIQAQDQLATSKTELPKPPDILPAPGSDVEVLVLQVAAQPPQPKEVTPVQPPSLPPQLPAPASPTPPVGAADPSDLFGGRGRQAPAGTPGTPSVQQAAALPTTSATNVIGGGEATGRATTDVGDLLGKSLNAVGVAIQRRNPIVSDARVRGYQSGQVVTTADGGYFFPARPDLDTIVSRIDSSIVDNIVITKGPYTVRRGPGFSFIDIETRSTPRYAQGFEGHGSTSLIYKSNGQGWNGRQTVLGGGPDWGYRVGWDILAANDYKTGGTFFEPSSYNSQNFDFSTGFDLTQNLGLEFKYFRQHQRNVEFPGALIDINSLVCDAFDLRIVLQEGDAFRSTLDGWFNQTVFDGDNLRASKRAQVPQLNDLGGDGTGLTLNLVSDGANNSWGFRHATTFGRDKGPQVTAGWDFRYISEEINEFDTFFFQQTPGEVTFNFPVPRARQIDPGLFIDGNLPLSEAFNVKAGARCDFVNSRIQQPLDIPQPPPTFPPNPDPNFNATNAVTIANDIGAGAFAERHFDLWSAFAAAEYKLTDELTFLASYGYAQRPPSIVELYGDGPFLSLLQNGGTFVFGRGDPALRPEQLNQGDIGMKADYERLRGGVNGFYARIQDYITFEAVGNAALQVPGLQGFRYTNTGEATLAGGEAYGEYDLTDWLTPFFTMAYVNGRDVTRNQPLPGIYPYNARVGFRIHESGRQPRWGVEFTSRMVDGQHQVARNLMEAPTPGFTIFDLRAYWLIRTRFLLTAGLENIGNRLYQEAFDLRNGINGGVFQPGFNLYAGMRVSY